MKHGEKYYYFKFQVMSFGHLNAIKIKIIIFVLNIHEKLRMSNSVLKSIFIFFLIHFYK